MACSASFNHISILIIVFILSLPLLFFLKTFPQVLNFAAFLFMKSVDLNSLFQLVDNGKMESCDFELPKLK